MKIIKEERNLLKSVIKGLISRIDEIRDYLEKKLSGIKTSEISCTFDLAIKTYESYYSLKYNKIGGGKIKDLLKKISFQNVVYYLTGKKYFCSCGCVGYLDEASNPKKKCDCRREYSIMHIQKPPLKKYCKCRDWRTNCSLYPN